MKIFNTNKDETLVVALGGLGEVGKNMYVIMHNDELIIIDSYADTTLLDIIKKLTCKVILITKNSDRLSNNDITRYNSQYHNLTIFRDNSFHDRYIIIDKKILYQSGTSINNAGKYIFSIYKSDDIFIKEKLLEIINEIINGGI